MKTSWDLTVLYKNDRDPQIEGDMQAIELACASIEKKYRKAAFTATPQALAKAFADFEDVMNAVEARKPWWYFTLKTHLNSDDAVSAARATTYEQRITDAYNRITFFGLEIAKIPKQKQATFLTHATLMPYKYALTRIFDAAKHNLTEPEEQLESLLSQTSYGMWTEMQDKVLNRQTVTHKGKTMPLPEAAGKLHTMPTKDRREVHQKLNTVLRSVSDSAEAEINAIYNYKKIMDTRRGFSKAYSATLLGNENDEKAIERFVELVTKRFDISKRFYALHAKLLDEKKLSLADRSTKIGDIRAKFDFTKSSEMLRGVLGTIDTEYVALFDAFLKNGQIDLMPKKGKRGGAYCWGMGTEPTFLLLNHVDDVRSLETFAHEMGHAIHTELSKQQPPRYQHYSTATAEVASTFFEQLIADEIDKHVSEKERLVLLHNRIMGDISTIFRQIACFNFEAELHTQIRTRGQVTKEAIAELMNKHLATYLGKTVELAPDDGYCFVSWMHIRRFFYVYTYAYGQLISRALYEAWKKDPAYAGKIKQFLSAGRSMSPENIFKSIGIDTSKTSFFEAGLEGISRDIDTLEKLAKKQGIIKSQKSK